MKKQPTKAKAKKKLITSFIVRSITTADRATLDQIKKRLQQVTDSQCMVMVLSDYWAMKEELRTTKNANGELLRRFERMVLVVDMFNKSQQALAKLARANKYVPNDRFIHDSTTSDI